MVDPVAADPRCVLLFVYEEDLTGQQFVHGSLDPGVYYWNVTTLIDGIEGLAGPVRSLTLVEDLAPPELSVTLPERVFGSGPLLIRGLVDPGARVLIGRDEVQPLASGEFEHSLLLEPGPNLVVVEAVDDVGNVAYYSRYVTATAGH